MKKLCIRKSYWPHCDHNFITFSMDETRKMKCFGPNGEINELSSMAERLCSLDNWEYSSLELNEAFNNNAKDL